MFKIKRESLDGKKKKDKAAEIKTEVDSKIKKYKADQKKQLQNGGPGPVADYEIMAVVNEYDSKYQIELPDDAPEIIPEVIP